MTLDMEIERSSLERLVNSSETNASLAGAMVPYPESGAMRVIKVRFDGQTFLLDPAQDVSDTKQAIVAAARTGSDFVDFRTVGHGTISLLVTPNLPVRFETIERTEAEIERIEADPPPIDSVTWDDYDL